MLSSNPYLFVVGLDPHLEHPDAILHRYPAEYTPKAIGNVAASPIRQSSEVLGATLARSLTDLEVHLAGNSCAVRWSKFSITMPNWFL